MKKIIILGVIALFVGVSVFNSVSSKDLSIFDDKILEDNNKNEPVDDYEEIITIIDGVCKSVTREGFYYNEPISMHADYFIVIKGLKKPFSGDFGIFFEEYPSYVKASRFYGWAYVFAPREIDVWGFAIGNIDWS